MAFWNRSNRGTPTVEFRDPVAATRPTSFYTPGMPMVTEWDAERALQYGYYANAIVYRCVEIIA